MTDKKKVQAFERKLQQLKEEESQILKLLKDVRRQLEKYEVEELQTCNESVVNRDEEESDSDDSIKEGNEMLLKILDSAQIINSSTLDLGLSQILKDESNEESEETDDSD